MKDGSICCLSEESCALIVIFRSNDFFSLKNNSLRIGSKRSKPTHPFFLNSFFLSGVGFCPALLIDSGSLEILLGGGGGGGISRRL